MNGLLHTTIRFHYCPGAYFREQRLPMLNNSAGCSTGFNDMSVSYSGDQWCNLFASRAVCKVRCLRDCQLDNLYSVTCPKIDCGPDGNSAGSITIQCYCSGSKKDGSGNNNCNTAPITWSEVENYYMMFCQQGKSLSDVLGLPTQLRTNSGQIDMDYDYGDTKKRLPVSNNIQDQRYESVINENTQIENKNVNIHTNDIIFVDASGRNDSPGLSSHISCRRMLSTTGFILLSIAFLECFSYGESCCPYFKDGRFNATARRLNRGSNCREPFTDYGKLTYCNYTK
uniref:Uncharacterized protein n=1 Tax=Romanomermis culicivorax TaxID=13658 RepID=A0A915L2P1_ROMCU